MSDTPTVGSLLQFDFEKPPHDEIEKLRKIGGLVAGAYGTSTGLPTHYWQAAGANVFRALGTALDRPVTELLAGGWNHYEPFLKYRNQKPGAPVQEQLLKHTIDASLSPSIKVLLNGKQVGEIKFKLLVALKLEAGTLTIQDGKFMSLRPGKCWATATLSCAGHTVLERKTSALVLPGEVHFGAGIRIVPSVGHALATG